MSRTVAAIAIVSIATLAARAQSLDPNTIHGRVLAADSGDPLPHARVVLFNDAAPVSTVFTDHDGKFALPSLATGRYRLSVTKAGYTATTISRLPDNTRADGVDVRIPRSCAISGRVVDSLGEPSAGLAVSASLRGRAIDVAAVVKTVRTDDLGEYRLGGLAEGSFVVSVEVLQTDAQLDNRGNFARIAKYYPGVTALADAEVISLRAGDQKAGVASGVPCSPKRTGALSSPTFPAVLIRSPPTNPAIW